MPTKPITPEPFMSPAELGRVLGVTTKTLRDWRLSTPMRGPAFLKFGDGNSSRVRYPREAVAAWIESRTTAAK
jgi:hypothetical protein